MFTMGMLCVLGVLILASERSLVSTAESKDPGQALEAVTGDQITSEIHDQRYFFSSILSYSLRVFRNTNLLCSLIPLLPWMHAYVKLKKLTSCFIAQASLISYVAYHHWC